MKFHLYLLIQFVATSLSAAEFRAGFAQADITPPVGWRRAGNYTERTSTGVNDPLMTKAMVVQDGATANCAAASRRSSCGPRTSQR